MEQQKPKLNKNISLKDFKDYYWLKEELIAFCREVGINRSGGKIEIATRIEKYLESGEIITRTEAKKPKGTSTFDWGKEKLELNTIITDSYRNSTNVRKFFIDAIGNHFKFNTEFMDWMKNNHGKTLADAVEQWKKIGSLKSSKDYQTTIAPQFEYNTYIRDFLADNPKLSTKDAMFCWKTKRDMPGTKKYEKNDLEFIN